MKNSEQKPYFLIFGIISLILILLSIPFSIVIPITIVFSLITGVVGIFQKQYYAVIWFLTAFIWFNIYENRKEIGNQIDEVKIEKWVLGIENLKKDQNTIKWNYFLEIKDKEKDTINYKPFKF